MVNCGKYFNFMGDAADCGIYALGIYRVMRGSTHIYVNKIGFDIWLHQCLSKKVTAPVEWRCEFCQKICGRIFLKCCDGFVPKDGLRLSRWSTLWVDEENEMYNNCYNVIG